MKHNLLNKFLSLTLLIMGGHFLTQPGEMTLNYILEN